MTTASTVRPIPFGENRWAKGLLLAFVGVLGLSLIQPAMVFDWVLENILVAVLLLVLGFSYRRLPLSDLSYLSLFLFLCLHEWGANHKYADVPLGLWMKDWLSTPRNHYDRVVHFAFGLFFAYPWREFFLRAVGARPGWAYILPVETALALGATYEIIESMIAEIVTPEQGEAFVGMQGDIWDAQKDMALGALGAALCMALVAICKRTGKLNS